MVEVYIHTTVCTMFPRERNWYVRGMIQGMQPMPSVAATMCQTRIHSTKVLEEYNLGVIVLILF